MSDTVVEEITRPATFTPPAARDKSERAGRLLSRYEEVRNFSLRLCETLEPEDFVVQSMP